MGSRKRGIDQLFSQKGGGLTTGGSFRIRLVKGPNGTIYADPVDPRAPLESFPLVAKFSESVVKPNFQKIPWKDGRLYQQDVPKPAADSDEEEVEQPKKRWKYNRRRQDAPRRQWILQEQVDFLETMVARREKRAMDSKKLSSRYEGLPEHNPSHYVLLSQSLYDDEIIQVQNVPAPNGTIAFAQPASRKTYSLAEAEQVIEDQRAGVKVKTMHGHNEESNGGGTLRFVPKSKDSSKSRLLNKLTARAKVDADDEADDVMGDVTYKHRKGSGGGSKARKELFNHLGDGVKVSDDGVLGGTNDGVFGGRQRFGQFHAEAKKAASTEGGDGNEEKGADGLAMADDFYQRDVQAEYEELDYDASEQFDDDDVDLGEGEMHVDGGGYGEEDEDQDLSDLELEEEVVGGAEGLATAAGFKMLLAKARGELSAQPAAADDSDTTSAISDRPKKDDNARGSPVSKSEADKPDEDDYIVAIKAAAEKSRIAATEKAKAQTAAAATVAVKPMETASAIETDENGLRLITLEAVRREIWLNHGQIPIKRLMKIFDVKKKSAADRQNKFREVVKELCIMKSDPVGGRLLVLKQHYSNM
jgi:hypothetical protein